MGRRPKMYKSMPASAIEASRARPACGSRTDGPKSDSRSHSGPSRRVKPSCSMRASGSSAGAQSSDRSASRSAFFSPAPTLCYNSQTDRIACPAGGTRMFLSLSDTRDIAVIAYSIAGTVAFVLIIFFTLAIGILSWMTLSRVRGMLKNNVQPTLESVRQTSESVRGTVEFVSDYAVAPVVKTYGTVAGVRQFVVVLSRLGRSRKSG